LVLAAWGCGGGVAASVAGSAAVPAPAPHPAPEPAVYHPPSAAELVERCRDIALPTTATFTPPDWFLIGDDHEPRSIPLDELQARAHRLRTELETLAHDDTRRPAMLEELARVLFAISLDHADETAIAEACAASIRAYATVVQEHPNYPRMDEVLGGLARGLERVRQLDRAREVYRRLIKGFPESRRVPPAYASFARFYEGERDYGASARFWSKVAEHPHESLAGYASYRLGWLDIECGRRADATRHWEAALHWVEEHPGSPLALELAHAVESEMCIVLSEPRAPETRSSVAALVCDR
jgi:hypothetical protein